MEVLGNVQFRMRLQRRANRAGLRPGEQKLDNNTATYPVFFSLSQP